MTTISISQQLYYAIYNNKRYSAGGLNVPEMQTELKTLFSEWTIPCTIKREELIVMFFKKIGSGIVKVLHSDPNPATLDKFTTLSYKFMNFSDFAKIDVERSPDGGIHDVRVFRTWYTLVTLDVEVLTTTVSDRDIYIHCSAKGILTITHAKYRFCNTIDTLNDHSWLKTLREMLDSFLSIHNMILSDYQMCGIHYHPILDEVTGVITYNPDDIQNVHMHNIITINGTENIAVKRLQGAQIRMRKQDLIAFHQAILHVDNCATDILRSHNKYLVITIDNQRQITVSDRSRHSRSFNINISEIPTIDDNWIDQVVQELCANGCLPKNTTVNAKVQNFTLVDPDTYSQTPTYIREYTFWPTCVEQKGRECPVNRMSVID